MEFVNRVEIQGRVGTIKLNVCFDRIVATISVETETIVNEYSVPCVERTWHQVTAVEGDKTKCLADVFKGTNVRVVGRIRQMRYTSASGEEKVFHEIVADELAIIE